MNKADQLIFKEIVETHGRAVAKMPLGAEKPKMQAYFEWLIATIAREADGVIALEGVLVAMSKMVKRAMDIKDPSFRDEILGQMHEQLQRVTRASEDSDLEEQGQRVIKPSNIMDKPGRVNERGDPVPAGWKKIGIIR